MQRFIAAVVVVLVLSIAGAAQAQQPPCGPHALVLARLAAEFGEVPAASGLPGGATCLLAAGDGWQPQEAKPPERGADVGGLLSLVHDNYAWVRDPQYVTRSGAHCCSEQHCRPAEVGELTPIPGGWRHNPTGTEIHYDKPGIYPTEDPAGRVFRCVLGNALVCVFEGSGT